MQIEYGVMSLLPFKADRAVVQRQSIRGFLEFAPEAQLLLCSEYSEQDLGIEFEKEFKSRVSWRKLSPDVPSIKEVLRKGFEFSNGRPIFYQNSDVMMIGNSKNLPSIQEPFLLTGVRLPPSKQKKRLTSWDLYRARMGRDWFYLSEDCLLTMPDFYIGRYFWDDWLIRYAVRSRVTAVDMSEEFRCIDLESGLTEVQRHLHHGPNQPSSSSIVRGVTLGNPWVRHNYLVGGYKTGVWSVMAIPRRYTSHRIVQQRLLPFVLDWIDRVARAPIRAILYRLRKRRWDAV